jgi:CheY-like chemotaxis protein
MVLLMRVEIAEQRAERLLFVDDEVALVSLIARGLGRLGYRITGCSDPVQALEAFRVEPAGFDAVITDLAMPGMSGFQLARQIRAIRADIPILLMSGFVSAQDETEANTCTIREIVLKPITLDKLGDALARVFSRAEPGAHDT